MERVWKVCRDTDRQEQKYPYATVLYIFSDRNPFLREKNHHHHREANKNA